MKNVVSDFSDQIRGISYGKGDLHDDLNENSIILLRANNISDGELNFDDVVYVDRSRVSEKQILRKGDIVVCASSGSKHLVGKAAQVDFDDEVTFGAFLKVIRPKHINADYLGKYFLSDIYRKSITAVSEGVNINNIRNEHLDKLQITVPTEKEQMFITMVISIVLKIIKLRKQQLTDCDQLIKSRFIEIFGDIFTNEKGFKIGVFNDFVSQMNIGPFGSALKNDCFVKKEDGYCVVYEQKHAIRKNIEVDRRYVDLNKFNELSRFEVGPGDLIVSCRGTIGECHILPNDAPRGIIHPSLMMIKPNFTVNAKFLLHLLERILERQLDSGSGVKMAIQAKELSKVKTIVPDRYLQDEYILFVEKVDNFKFYVQQSIDETQKLFDSLMQEYFG